MILTGFAFPKCCSMSADVLMVREQFAKQGRPQEKVRLDNAWAYDFSFSVCGYYKLVKPHSSWQPRQPNIGHLYAPGTAFWEKDTARDGKWHSAYILFTGGEQMGLNRLMNHGFAEIQDKEKKTGILLSEMVRIGVRQKEAGYLKILSYFYALMDILLNSQKITESSHVISTISPHPEQNKSLSQQASEYFENNLSESLTLDKIAKALHVSPSTLSHTFREESNATPMEVLRRMRIERARLMLLSRMKFKIIARECGFYDEYHFSRTFKQMEGIAPKKYLRKQD